MRPPSPARRPAIVLSALLAALLAACSGGAPAPVATLDPDAPALVARPDPAATPTPSPNPPAPAAPTPTPTPSPTADGTPQEAPPPPPRPEVLGTFDVELAPEASGIVASRVDPDLLWIVDDGPGTTSILGVRHDGTLVTELQMEGVEGRDTEDIAAGPCGADDPSPCLFVGDIGDNRAVRDRILVHRFPEPADAASATTTPVATAAYTIPGGPVDAEGLLVTDDGLPVVLSKELDRTRVLMATAFADGPLVQAAVVPLPTPAQPLLTLVVGLTVTGADRSPDGDRVLLRTYDTVVELTAPEPGAPLATLDRWTAVELPAPVEPQGEAVAYLPDGRSYVTVSEGIGVISVVRR